jgi:hypothetical protein
MKLDYVRKNLNCSVCVIPGLIRNLYLPENNGFRIKPGMTLLGAFYDTIKPDYRLIPLKSRSVIAVAPSSVETVSLQMASWR